RAFDFGQRLLDNHPQVATADQIRFTLGAAGLRSGDHGQAQAYFGQVAAGASDLREKAVMAQGLTYAHRCNWETAAQTFASVADDSEYAMKARYCERLSREGSDLVYKNRHLAGVLAIVPGLGYLYDGYPQTAMSALVINGLFMWGTYEAFDQDHPGLGVTLAVFGIGWYAGNIYGSITSATRKNEKMRQDLLLRFEIGYEF
ncbi:MAG: hypothetical protein KAW46_12790, partial [candidate division Zixibacteria bacterium]|nr:hypothetical protein [candidate division Zixibacteria bacterium]